MIYLWNNQIYWIINRKWSSWLDIDHAGVNIITISYKYIYIFLLFKKKPYFNVKTFKMIDLTVAPLCPHVAMWCQCLITGCPKRVMNPKACTIRISLWPLSNVHYAFLSGSFYVYFMIDCLHLFGTCQVFDLWLWFPVFDEHFHIDPPRRN